MYVLMHVCVYACAYVYVYMYAYVHVCFVRMCVCVYNSPPHEQIGAESVRHGAGLQSRKPKPLNP